MFYLYLLIYYLIYLFIYLFIYSTLIQLLIYLLTYYLFTVLLAFCFRTIIEIPIYGTDRSFRTKSNQKCF